MRKPSIALILDIKKNLFNIIYSKPSIIEALFLFFLSYNLYNNYNLYALIVIKN